MNVAERSLGQRQKFRVVIVGLLQRQFGDIETEFPELDLRHVRNDISTPDISPALLRAADHVVCMTRFISHGHVEQVKSICDPARVTYLSTSSGITPLRAKLSALSNQARLLSDAKVISLPVRDAAPAYAIDFSALRQAQLGEPLTFTRPNAMPAHVFRSECESALTFYRKETGLPLAVEVTSNRAVFTIPETLARAEAQLLEPSERPESARNTRRFWRDVYLESYRLRPNADAAEHARYADAAMSGWLSLFPKGVQ